MERDETIINLRKRGMTYAEIANETDTTRGTVAGVIYRRNKRTMPAPTHIIRLTEQHTDTAAWDKTKSRIMRQSIVTIAHDNDIHFPYHDPDALELRYQIYAQARPDVIVVGSDVFDFPTISRFAPDPDVTVDDWLDSVAPYWHAHIDRLREVAPFAALVFIVGNHDARAIVTINKSDAKRVLYKAFVDMVRSDKRVYWLGSKATQIQFNNLVVAHGWKANKHTADAMLREFDYQASVMAGHTHRPDYFTRCSLYTVQSVIAGCACQLLPHYETSKQHTGWQHGVAIATLAHDNVFFENIVFQPTVNGLYTRYRGKTLTAQNANDNRQDKAA